MADHEGHVRLEGAIWKAEPGDDLKRGDRVKVLGVDGLTLRVTREGFQKAGQ
jgi:membrane protein implicated in regulation of membrane protease activity